MLTTAKPTLMRRQRCQVVDTLLLFTPFSSANSGSAAHVHRACRETKGPSSQTSCRWTRGPLQAGCRSYPGEGWQEKRASKETPVSPLYMQEAPGCIMNGFKKMEYVKSMSPNRAEVDGRCTLIQVPFSGERQLAREGPVVVCN